MKNTLIGMGVILFITSIPAIILPVYLNNSEMLRLAGGAWLTMASFCLIIFLVWLFVGWKEENNLKFWKWNDNEI